MQIKERSLNIFLKTLFHTLRSSGFDRPEAVCYKIGHKTIRFLENLNYFYRRKFSNINTNQITFLFQSNFLKIFSMVDMNNCREIISSCLTACSICMCFVVVSSLYCTCSIDVFYELLICWVN